MEISTGLGDKGKTSIYFGRSKDKDHIRIQIYGALDELCSALGVCKSQIKQKKIRYLIESIQTSLFIIGGEIATEAKYLKRLQKRLSASDLKSVEKDIEYFEKNKRFKACCFYLPGASFSGAVFDLARTVARRAERQVVSFRKKGMLKNEYILPYLNRISDLLFLLARKFDKNPRQLKF